MQWRKRTSLRIWLHTVVRKTRRLKFSISNPSASLRATVLFSVFRFTSQWCHRRNVTRGGNRIDLLTRNSKKSGCSQLARSAMAWERTLPACAPASLRAHLWSAGCQTPHARCVRSRKSAQFVAFIILEQNKALEAAIYPGHPLKRPALEKLVNNRSRWLRLPLFWVTAKRKPRRYV